MKECVYCGRENEDATVFCRGCGTELNADGPAEPLPKLGAGLEFVTVASCERLANADVVVSRLEAAGIETFLPDQFLMQTIGFNLNTYGYVRVQVHRKDLESAKELLAAPAAPGGGS